MELAAQVIGPQHLPQAEDIIPWEFPLIPDEEHAEEEEEVGGVCRLQMCVQLRVHELYKMIEGDKLRAHPGLVTEKVSFLQAGG